MLQLGGLWLWKICPMVWTSCPGSLQGLVGHVWFWLALGKVAATWLRQNQFSKVSLPVSESWIDQVQLQLVAWAGCVYDLAESVVHSKGLFCLANQKLVHWWTRQWMQVEWQNLPQRRSLTHRPHVRWSLQAGLVLWMLTWAWLLWHAMRIGCAT